MSTINSVPIISVFSATSACDLAGSLYRFNVFFSDVVSLLVRSRLICQTYRV